MSGKKIYSTEFKLNAVQKYLSGKYSYRDVANEVSCSKGDVIKWVAAYREHGVSGLCTTYRNYSGDFKVAVVEYIKNTETSIGQTAAYFNISSHTTVAIWERIYDELGKKALYVDYRRRSKHMKNHIKKRTQKKNVQTNQELLAEIQRLHMENEYLKKLNALIQEREKSEKPIK